MVEIPLKGLPKISLNKWYAGGHWTSRKKIKDNYFFLVKSQFKDVFSKTKQYDVSYTFFFKTKPLDASNAVAMVKLIEDIIFEDDKWDIILRLSIESRKAKDDYVLIKVTEM